MQRKHRQPVSCKTFPGRGPQHSDDCGARAENRLLLEKARPQRVAAMCAASGRNVGLTLCCPPRMPSCVASAVWARPNRLCSTRLLSAGDNIQLACVRTPSWLSPPGQVLPNTSKSTAAEPSSPKNGEELSGATSRTGFLLLVSAERRLYDDSNVPECVV